MGSQEGTFSARIPSLCLSKRLACELALLVDSLIYQRDDLVAFELLLRTG